VCVSEPELLNYKTVKIDAIRQFGSMQVNLYQVVNYIWRSSATREGGNDYCRSYEGEIV
jgi:hypothetical protein